MIQQNYFYLHGKEKQLLMATRPESTEYAFTKQISFRLSTNDVIINSGLPILLHINSNIDLGIMQQGPTNRVVPEASEIHINNCCTKVLESNSLSKVIQKYIEACGSTVLSHARSQKVQCIFLPSGE